MALFHLKDLNVGYNGVAALRGVSLSIAAGERVALVGSNGAGKSTLLHTLRAQRPEAVTLIPQDISLVRPLGVFHNVYMGRLHRHNAFYNLLNLVHPLRREVDNVRPWLHAMELEDKLGTPVAELSGGEQQRVAVARALFQGGSVLLGDEPVSAVDQRMSRRVVEALLAQFETIVLSLHDTELALAYMQRIVGLQGGRVVLDAPASELTPAQLQSLYHKA